MSDGPYLDTCLWSKNLNGLDRGSSQACWTHCLYFICIYHVYSLYLSNKFLLTRNMHTCTPYTKDFGFLFPFINLYLILKPRSGSNVLEHFEWAEVGPSCIPNGWTWIWALRSVLDPDLDLDSLILNRIGPGQVEIGASNPICPSLSLMSSYGCSPWVLG